MYFTHFRAKLILRVPALNVFYVLKMAPSTSSCGPGSSSGSLALEPFTRGSLALEPFEMSLAFEPFVSLTFAPFVRD